MNGLRISVVYPSGYAPVIASCGVLAMYPMINNEHPIKIGVRVAGTHTNDCRTQELLLTHIVFDELEKAQEFCDKAFPCMQNNDSEAYKNLVEAMLASGEMKSVGYVYYK